MPELSTSAPRARASHRASARERRRRAEALQRTRAESREVTTDELAYVRAQLHVAASLTARLASAEEVKEMAELVVGELHTTFAFYLAAIQRLGDDHALRLVAASGPLAQVMTEFLLVEQSIEEGVNGRVARSGTSALVVDTTSDPDYIVRDPQTDPRSELSVPIVVDGAIWGVLNIEAAEPDAFGTADMVLVEAIAASFGSAVHRAGLIADLERAFTTTLATLMSTIEAKDGYTASHEQDVAELAERVARRLGLSAREARDVRYAALLHDIGKISVPSEILLKRGSLTDEEWVVMRRHVDLGADLVERIEAFAHLAPAVRSSHERWDGEGYPQGLSEQQIPLAGRIIAACDTFDAIITQRPYRRARTHTRARAELRKVSGAQLDPLVVSALLEELAGAPTAR